MKNNLNPLYEFFGSKTLNQKNYNGLDKIIPVVEEPKYTNYPNPLTLKDFDNDAQHNIGKRYDWDFSHRKELKDLDLEIKYGYNKEFVARGYGGSNYLSNREGVHRANYIENHFNILHFKSALDMVNHSIENYNNTFNKEMEEYNKYLKSREYGFDKVLKCVKQPPDYKKGLDDLMAEKNNLTIRLQELEKQKDLYRELAQKESDFLEKRYKEQQEKNAELKKDYDKKVNERKLDLEKRAQKITQLQQIGSTLGLIGGGAGGNYLASKIGKIKQRNDIKSIIISSNNPNEAIQKLSQIGTKIANRYCNRISKFKDQNNWKELTIGNISLKNSLIRGSGIVGGSIIGGGLGNYAGEKIGYSIYG